MTAPRLLYLDAYDSFSNNITTLLESHLCASVSSIKIDDSRFVLNDDAFIDFLAGFDAVVAGPGPGHPGNAQDVGLISKLYTLPDEHMLPVLGICLGFQRLCLAFGASVERLREPRHGLVTPVTHCNRDVFQWSGEVLATQYHSLHVRLGQEDLKMSELSTPTKACKDLQPLAWDLSSLSNGPILMAARHIRKPFWGVQYHPESICTNDEGRRLIRDWWREVCVLKELHDGPRTGSLSEEELQNRVDSGRASEDVRASKVRWHELPLPKSVTVVDLVNSLRDYCEGHGPLLLESGTRNVAPVNAETGRYSIIGVHNTSSTHVRYSTRTHRLNVTNRSRALLDRETTTSDVIDYLGTFTAEHKAIGGPDHVPFWGGLVGYISYEAGLETIDVKPPEVSAQHPDVWFVFVERSVVVDHVNGRLYVQSLTNDDWVDQTVAKLKRLRGDSRPAAASPCEPAEIVSEPQKEDYCAKVRACQAQLRAGESYELCLTATTLLQPSSSNEDDTWSLYRRLRALNPAPFGAYLNLSLPASTSSTSYTGGIDTADLHIASSSPERFLSWSRDGECQFRPIKGTVKKSPNMTRERAEEILREPKEQAENLMIVDLIRHDLSGVKGVTDVTVPKLMAIEEYATVYQLVSVIQGSAESPVSVLAASLPPGSMTGAPKKRSCELLRKIEGTEFNKGGANHTKAAAGPAKDEPEPTTAAAHHADHTRGIYSGVLGYLDVGGGGDFSVAIRTAFKWSDEGCWRVGAGGAVTVLSEAVAEWEEMGAKRESVLRAFGALR